MGKKFSSEWLPSYIKPRDRFSRRSRQQLAINKDINIIAAVITTATSTSTSAAPTIISNSSHFHLSVQHNFKLSQSQGTVQCDLATKDSTPNSTRARHGDINGEILTPALGEGEVLASLSVSFTPR